MPGEPAKPAGPGDKPQRTAQRQKDGVVAGDHGQAREGPGSALVPIVTRSQEHRRRGDRDSEGRHVGPRFNRRLGVDRVREKGEQDQQSYFRPKELPDEKKGEPATQCRRQDVQPSCAQVVVAASAALTAARASGQPNPLKVMLGREMPRAQLLSRRNVLT